jgi:hypothetical protein
MERLFDAVGYLLWAPEIWLGGKASYSVYLCSFGTDLVSV